MCDISFSIKTLWPSHFRHLVTVTYVWCMVTSSTIHESDLFSISCDIFPMAKRKPNFLSFLKQNIKLYCDAHIKYPWSKFTFFPVRTYQAFSFLLKLFWKKKCSNTYLLQVKYSAMTHLLAWQPMRWSLVYSLEQWTKDTLDMLMCSLYRRQRENTVKVCPSTWTLSITITTPNHLNLNNSFM